MATKQDLEDVINAANTRQTHNEWGTLENPNDGYAEKALRGKLDGNIVRLAKQILDRIDVVEQAIAKLRK